MFAVENFHLVAFRTGGRRGDFLVVFKRVEELFGAGNKVYGKAGQTSDFNSITLINSAFTDLMKEEDAGGGFRNVNRVVFSARELFCEFNKFVVMGCKKAESASFKVKVFKNCPSQAEAVVS